MSAYPLSGFSFALFFAFMHFGRWSNMKILESKHGPDAAAIESYLLNNTPVQDLWEAPNVGGVKYSHNVL